MKHIYLSSLLVLMLLNSFVLQAQSVIRYVKPNDVSNAWQSKPNVYSDLQLALADAVSGDEIWVSEGIYKPTTTTDRSISFELIAGVKLYGGFKGTESLVGERRPHKNETILSGDIGVSDDKSDNTYTVVKAVGTDIAPINKTTVFDGFIVMHGNNQIYGWHSGSGGGMRCEVASPFVANVVFKNNKANNDGAGVYCADGSNATFINCSFIANTSYMGAGAYLVSDGSFYNCLWYNNVSDKSSASYGTSAEGYGIDLYAYNSGNGMVANSIFVTTDNNSGAFKPVSGVTERNIIKSSNPGFVSMQDGDFRLRSTSVAVDAGDNSYLTGIDADYYGNNRLINNVVDAGPFEGAVITPENDTPSNYEAINADGASVTVNFTGRWSETPNYTITRYFIQYWNDLTSIATVDITSDLTHSQSFMPGQNISWRYGVELDNGTINYSKISYFSLPSQTPFFVKSGMAGNGSSWANAFGSIHEALSVAVNGDEIWVAEGTYLPSVIDDRDESFTVATGVKIYGGFKGSEANREDRNAFVNKTILSGNIGDATSSHDNSKHVMVISTNAEVTIDGFVIQDGYAGDSRGQGSIGAGLMISRGTQIISNVLFKNNEANRDGGAIAINDSETLVVNCIFKNNKANDGGAINRISGRCKIVNAVFDTNYGRETSAVENAESISNSIFTNNVSYYNYSSIRSSSTNYNRLERVYGNQNITEEVVFVDAANDDYRLNSISAGINVACNDSLPEWLTKDFAGKARVQEVTVDMGAFEGAVICPVASSPVDASVFKTNKADFLVEFIGGWISSADYPISKYIIEFWEKGSETTRVETTNEFVHSVNLPAGKEYFWRSGVIAKSGEINYSNISRFSIAKDTPYFVKEGSAGDGSSWTKAFGSINEAIDLAVDGDEIWIAAGTYNTTPDVDRTKSISFEVSSGIKLYGGFKGDETELNQRNWRLHKTILSGEVGDPLDDTDNTNRIINYNNTNKSTAIFDGLIISDAYCYGEGAGLRIVEGTARVVNCVFENNWAYQGTAISTDNGELQCYNSIFRNNEASWSYVIEGFDNHHHISNCVFVKNEVDNVIGGEGILTNSIVWGNALTGSAVYNMSKINNCIQNFTSTTNISDDPLFMDIDAGDYRLHYKSPCINSGNKEELPADILLDYYGNSRIVSEQVDMGIVEGGVVTPLATKPVNKAVIQSSEVNVNVLVSWDWEKGLSAPTVDTYDIEYWVADGVVNTINGLSEMKTMIPTESGTRVYWRIISNINGELPLRGIIQSFSVTHNHPIYVKEGAVGDGTSWDNAFGSLQDAMEYAVDGDELWISAGTYYPAESDRLKSFELKNKFKLYGGFNGTETLLSERNWIVNKTILSGEIGSADSKNDNSTHVVECLMSKTDSAWVDGVTIRDGYANSWSQGNQYGGGVYATKGNLFITNTVITQCHSDEVGSALYNEGAAVTIINSILNKNNARYNGGSTVYHGSGSTRLINCVVTENTGSRYGGLFGNTNGLEAVNSILWGNSGSNNNDVYNAKVTYSLLGRTYDGDGNIVGNPLFVDADNDDYRLQIISPAINVGINDSIPEGIKTDFSGVERVLHDVVDIGCFEGGVVTPIAQSPADNVIVKGVFLGTDVTFEWSLPEGYDDIDFESYRLDYWTDAESKLSITGITELNTTVSLNNGNEYKWQVVALKDGEEFPSHVKSFSLTHYYALKVKEGSSGYGDRWDYAFGNLQDAIDEAVRGDVIWIAKGTYYPSETDNRSDVITINKQLKIYGGFKGSEVYLKDRPLNPTSTILSGDIGITDVLSDNSYGIIAANLSDGDTLLIDGLTIEKAFVDSWSNNKGAVYLNGGNLKVINSIIQDNQSIGDGGGIKTSGGNLDLINSAVIRNKANYGAGIYAYEGRLNVYNSLFTKNTAQSGSALYTYSMWENISNSIIWDNNGEQLYGVALLRYSVTEKDGAGNINEDPLFVDAENGNYRLLPHSPAINAGSNDSIPEGIQYDLDGIGRVSWATVDMGPYEASYPKTVRPADKSPERPSGVLGYTWTLGADMDGNTPDPNMMDANEYNMSFKTWDIDDVNNVYEEYDNISYWGFMSFNFDYRQGYQWRVGVQTETYTYWSDTATFYVGGADPLYVKAGSTGDGSSWDNAFGSINDAVEASIKGDEIWVANGTYKVTTGTDRKETLNLGSYIGLYGGFAGTETQRYERFSTKEYTIISGDIGTANDDSDNTHNLITIQGSAQNPAEGVVIDGFLLTGVNAEGNNGGAINANYASYRVLNSYLSENKSNNGAAIYNVNAESNVYNSQIDNNTSTGAVVYGDADSKLEMVNTTVTANAGGIKSPGKVLNTIVYGNSGTQLSDAEAAYSCIEDGYVGTNIVTGSPDFMDAAQKDYRLGMYSSCYNQGNDAFLPGMAYLDLYKNERRSFYGRVDIGAFEVGPFQLGKIEVVEITPNNGSAEVEYDAPISITFNKAIKVVDFDDVIMTPQNLIFSTELVDEGIKLNLNHYRTLVFGETYTIEIPAEAIEFVNNSEIPSSAVSFSFTIRDCKPAVITPEATNLDLCLYDVIELPVAFDGDYLEGYKWMKSDTVYYENDYYPELRINKFTNEYSGVYTMSVEDMCGNTITKDVTLSLKKSNPIVLKDKWDDVLFIDNANQYFSDFEWFVSESSVSDKQYLDLSDITGEVFVTATDSESGCTIYSDTITISGGGLKSMKVHPNPVQQNQTIIISLPKEQTKAQISLYDITGALVASDAYENTHIIDYENTNVKPGIYILEVRAAGLVEQRKIIIQK